MYDKQYYKEWYEKNREKQLLWQKNYYKENNDLYNRIAELIEANEKEVKNLKWIKDHDYIFLIDENKKLHAEIKKLKEGIVDRARKAGL